MISYIFAYGSLLDKESRETTLKTDFTSSTKLAWSISLKPGIL